MTTPTMPAITLRYIRSDPSTEEDDDTLRITFSHFTNNNQDPVMKCVFTPGQQNTKKSHEFFDLVDNVEEYLALTFKLLRRDDDPYDSIQADIPAYPSFIFSISNFKPSCQRLVLKAISSVMNDWPWYTKSSKSSCTEKDCGRYFAPCDCMEVDTDN